MNGIGFGTGWKRTALAGALIGLTAVGARAGNAVGYVKTNVPASSLKLMSMPFVQIDGRAHTLDSAMPSVPDGTEVWVFVRGAPDRWDTYTYLEGDGWLDGDFDPAGDVELARGAGFWFKNTSAEEVVLHLRGLVPTSGLNKPMLAGVQLVSFGFPSSAELGDSGPAAPADGDELYVHLGGVSWYIYTYLAGDGWTDEDLSPADVALQPGAAYWYKAVSALTWNQARNFGL